MPQVFETLLGDRTLSIETGKLANQADGAVVPVSYTHLRAHET